ncbi:hypothetical protein MAR_037752 [Mya arenaria]|uniref:Uncharacterized protein n=1 Tax=Mya arenaria TaxID=6604 RepID=A0ABY7FTF2_MYAAR|nr:hypothetical protein MAR_037752 [Mya arenaria]
MLHLPNAVLARATNEVKEETQFPMKWSASPRMYRSSWGSQGSWWNTDTWMRPIMSVGLATYNVGCDI